MECLSAIKTDDVSSPTGMEEPSVWVTGREALKGRSEEDKTRAVRIAVARAAVGCCAAGAFMTQPSDPQHTVDWCPHRNEV